MIWLIGMMGSGKSTVGPLVANRLRLPFIDLDAEITRAADASIPDIFTGEGEEGFRERESAALSEVADGPPAVVATGGGVVLDPANRDRMRATGVVVWLEAEPSVLAERVAKDVGRPLLVGADRAQRLEQLLAERGASYVLAAHARISTDALSPGTVAEEVSALWLAS